MSDRAIRQEIDSGNLVITPTVLEQDISTSSVDVHLGDTVLLFKPYHEAIIKSIDLSHPDVGTALRELLYSVDITDEGFALAPGQFVISNTKETITLPPHLAARLEGRSTNARFGITIHSTAPTVHPTYSGTLTLEICNFGSIACTLKKGMAIGQLIFEQVDTPSMKTLESRWQGQSTAI